MRIGWQELIALAIVLTVVAFALWRRWQRGRQRDSSCDGCDHAAATPTDEKPVHIYRRRE